MTKTSRRRKSLQNAFITTMAVAAAAASLGAGCSLPGEATNPPPCSFAGCTVECPAEQPNYDTPCEEIGLACNYGADDCGNPRTATCNAEYIWQIDDGLSCNPPPIECPEEIPANGDACEPGWGNTCFYDDTCGGQLEVTCIDNQWETPLSTPCNPPPPAACSQLTENECGERADCQFLAPGCSEGMLTLPEAGCFDTLECDELSCSNEDMSCQTVIIDPCYGANCNACGEERTLCLPDAAEGTPNE